MGVYLSHCPDCKSTAFHIWGVSIESYRLHDIQCICERCGLIFANPRVEVDEIQEFYRLEYSSKIEEGYLQADALHMNHDEKIRRLITLCPHGDLLDIGAGNGSFLNAARCAGYKVVGLEPAPQYVSFIKQHWDIEDVFQATLDQHRFPDACFDVVYSWHVIEHVLDIEEFIVEIQRILKPGGILVIGTENYRHCATYLTRFRERLCGRCPPFVSSHEHTYLFSKSSLRHCLIHRGFLIERLRAYHNPFSHRLRHLEFRNRLSQWLMPVREWRLAVPHMLDLLSRNGDRLEVYARKRKG